VRSFARKGEGIVAFGPTIQFTVGELNIELAPIAEGDVSEFVARGGFQLHEVTRFLGNRQAYVLKDEQEWYEKVRTQKDSYVWGIWLVNETSRTLIGSSGLHSIEGKDFQQATSGSVIFRPEYWGKGIASSAHKARTWYGFTQLGLTRIKSAVIVGNVASEKALKKSGYFDVYTERNDTFVDGEFRHKLCLECLNPNPLFWKKWWHKDRPSSAALSARTRTLESLDWAKNNVTLL
jgi:ribosomal-protein-alanine N-acetyltransferase